MKNKKSKILKCKRLNTLIQVQVQCIQIYYRLKKNYLLYNCYAFFF